ncbi:hypothetical protein BGX23_009963 [Mortierella sp. AD031]|nr:hypothetical protein BGX23_009963 [Mortierella sp. AD031]
METTSGAAAPPNDYTDKPSSDPSYHPDSPHESSVSPYATPSSDHYTKHSGKVETHTVGNLQEFAAQSTGGYAATHGYDEQSVFYSLPPPSLSGPQLYDAPQSTEKSSNNGATTTLRSLLPNPKEVMPTHTDMVDNP